MKIVIDSGATKADWLLFDENNLHLKTYATLGLNPECTTVKELENRVEANIQLTDVLTQVQRIYFYGSGCGVQRAQQIILKLLKKYCTKAIYFEVEEDTYAAIYSAVKKGEEAIVCINGTGSNCTHFNGEKIEHQPDFLGYLATDDCSGSDFGRQILKDFFLKIMPLDLRLKLESTTDLSLDSVKNYLYVKESPNAYMASFLPFLIENKNHPYFQKMIVARIEFFIDYYIMQIKNCKELPIYFIGSVAYLLQDEFQKILKRKGFSSLGNFIQKPIDGLIKNHTF